MIRSKICTNDVEKCIRTLCIRDGCDRRTNKIRKFLMSDKLQDAECEVKSANREFVKANKEYYEVIARDSAVDRIFKLVKEYEVSKEWDDGKVRNCKKIEQ